MTGGEGGSRPLLLLHGALGSSVQMAPIASALQAAGHAVHTMDFEGHGIASAGTSDSATVPDPTAGDAFSIPRFADAIVARVGAIGTGPVNVFGYSMGGYAALLAASIAPERFGRVATLGTKFAWSPEVAEREVARLDPDIVEAKVPRFAAALAERHGEARWRPLLRRTADLMLALGRAPVVTPELLGRIELPVRICVGDRDELVSIDESIDTYRALPQGELAVLPNTHHPVERASVDAILTALHGFFDMP